MTVEAEVTAAVSPGEAKTRRNSAWVWGVSVPVTGQAMSARAGPTATSKVEGWLMNEVRLWLPEVRGSKAAMSGSAYGRDQSVCPGAAALSRCASAVVIVVTGSGFDALPGASDGEGVGVDCAAEASTAADDRLGPRIAGSMAQVTFAFSVPWINLSRREPGPMALAHAAVRVVLAIP